MCSVAVFLGATMPSPKNATIFGQDFILRVPDAAAAPGGTHHQFDVRGKACAWLLMVSSNFSITERMLSNDGVVSSNIIGAIAR